VLPCIHAAQAGVDIYAEKPVTLTIAEGQALVKAVNKYQRVFQAGTQARSIAVNDWAVRQLASGVIGEIKKVIAPNFDGPVDYKPLARTSAAPAGLNWDFWCNQAPLFPFDLRLAARLEDGWAPYREFDGGGDRWGMTGFGAHAFDQILWALGKDLESPVEAWPHEPGNAMTAVSLRLADGLIIETLDTTRKGPAFGGIFVGDNGKMEINRNRVASNPAGIAQQLPKFPSEHTGGVNHVQNWLDSIRTRKTPRCPVEVAHRQTVICHVINAVRDLGRKLQYDPQTDRFVNDAEANRHPSVDRPRRRGYELPKVLG
jgi:predicted dehydrogenase